ncbi:hypothetical protein ABGB12_34645 [Actinocorallia sp. B10E7]|uniref:hypothetical protein n=1 Tax=Actinocorallia sp. B10E7 TaxID=3153558 RepID=UPI00325F2BC3
MRGLVTAAALLTLISACSASGGAEPKESSPSPVVDHKIGTFTVGEGGILVFTEFRSLIHKAITTWMPTYDQAKGCFSVQPQDPGESPASVLPVWQAGTKPVIVEGVHGIQIPDGRVILDGQAFKATIGHISDESQTSLQEALSAASLPASCGDSSGVVVLKP